MLNNKTILLTGGTGSFGKAFVETALKKYPKIKKLIVFSRDELKQHEMSKQIDPKKHPSIRFFLGDIRDRERLNRALKKVDIVIHAAALKQVPAAEYNPTEFIKTNVIGAQNLIESAIDNSVQKVIALSTDKAAAPINLYGATKLCSDKLFTAANNYSGKKKNIFSVVRYGNVWASRGSVVPEFIKISKNKNLFVPITDPMMTRFSITLQKGVDMVLWSIKNARGGEIFVPKIPSYKILDLAKSICPKNKIKVIGIRPGEKLHEELITKSDSDLTVDFGNYYAILPNTDLYKYYLKNYKVKSIQKNFSYNSQENKEFLSIKDLSNFLKEFR
jgi:UDP-N-acetylglucosamine 4,6-dehydratase/5-epimerase